MSERNQPTIKFKSQLSWGLNVAVWVTEKGTSWQIQKRYKDKTSGEYVTSSFLNGADVAALLAHIPDLMAQAQKLQEKQAEDYKKGLPPTSLDSADEPPF